MVCSPPASDTASAVAKTGSRPVTGLTFELIRPREPRSPHHSNPQPGASTITSEWSFTHAGSGGATCWFRPRPDKCGLRRWFSSFAHSQRHLRQSRRLVSRAPAQSRRTSPVRLPNCSSWPFYSSPLPVVFRASSNQFKPSPALRLHKPPTPPA